MEYLISEDRAEQPLRRGDLLFQTVFESSALGIALLDGQGRPVESNHALQALLGYPAEELHLMSFTEFTHPADIQKEVGCFEELLNGKRSQYKLEKRLVRKDGRVVWIRTTVSLLPAMDDPKYAVALVEDISERKKVEDTLRRHSLTFENIHDGVILTDLLGRTIDVNPAAERMFGYSRQEMLGKVPPMLGTPHHAELPLTAIMDAVNGGGRWTGEIDFWHRDGSQHVCESVAIPLLDEQDVPLAAIIVHHDITDRKRAERALARHAQHLQILRHIDQAILAARSMREIAAVATQHIREVVLCQYASVAIFDFEVGMARYLAVDAAYPTSVDTGQLLPLTAFGAADRKWSASVKEIGDLQDLADPLPVLALQRDEGARSYLSIPLVAGDTAVGVLDLASTTPGGFPDDSREIARQVADSLAVAMQNEQLHEAEQHARQTADKLRNANLALTRSLSLDAVLETLLDNLQMLIPYDSARVLLLNLDGEAVVRAMRDHEQGTDAAEGRRASHDVESIPPFRAIVENRQSQMLGDTALDAGWSHWPMGENVRNWLGIPLLAGGGVIGICSLEKAIPHFFTEDHRRWAEALAAQAAVAIHNAQLYEQVRSGRLQLQKLSRRLVELQESERRFIARELHDEASQVLASLMVGLRLLEREAQDPEAVIARAGMLRQVTDGVLENLHRLAMDLRPASLDHVGVVVALRHYVEAFSEKNRLQVEFETMGLDGERFPPEVEITVYRVVQEALTNVIRHARSTMVGVLLERREDRLIVIVEDNGIGFDTTEALAPGRLGLYGMRERAEMLGGSLVVESTIGSGTTVFVEVPYVHSNPHR